MTLEINTCDSAPDWEGFGKEIMESWPYGGVDGGDLQDLAVKYRIIIKVPGGFNPEIHEDDTCSAEPGDSWFLRNY